jgi:hypothetical protein
MRQSEGKRTAKRLSAIFPGQVRPDFVWSDFVWSDFVWSDFVWSDFVWSDFVRPDSVRLVREATEGRATAALAWLARILSSLLLKTASVLPAELLIGRATLRLPAAIEYNGGWLREATS